MAEARTARFDSIDALRCAGMIAVLTYHVGGLAGARPAATGLGHWVTRSLDSALILFFVISGYVISRPFVRALVDGRPVPDVRRYALRRAARVVPGYWIALLAVLLLVQGSGSQLGALPLQHWWQIPLHGLFLQDVVPGQIQALIRVAWTLENEIIFYALLPLLTVLLARRHPRGMSPHRLAAMVLGVWAASAAFALFADQLPAYTDGAAVARYTFPSMAGFFCPGILIAIADTQAAAAAGGIWGRLQRLLNSPRQWGLAFAGVFLLGILVLRGEAALGTRWLLLLDQHWQVQAIAFGALVGGFARGGERLERWSRPVARVGLASYGIYLWHTVVLHFVAQNHLWVSTDRMGILALPLNVMLVLGLTLPIATASWLLVEKRSLAWAERVARQWRGAAQPDVQPRVEPEAEAVPVPASGG